MNNDHDILQQNLRYVVENNSVNKFYANNSLDLKMEVHYVQLRQDTNQLSNESIRNNDLIKFSLIESRQNQNKRNQSIKLITIPVDHFQNKCNFGELNSFGKSAPQTIIKDVINVYNKMIHLLNNETKVNEIYSHNFFQCKVCSNYFLQISEDYNKTFSLLDAMNSITFYNDIYADESVTVYNKNCITEKTIHSKDISHCPTNFSKFSTIDTFSELATLKWEKCMDYFQYLTKLQNVSENIITNSNEIESVKEEVLNFSKTTLKDIMKMDYEILSCLMIYLQDFSHNKTGLLINIFEKINAIEQTLIKEFLLFLKEYVDYIKSNDLKLIEITDLSDMKVMCEGLNSAANDLGSFKNRNHCFEKDFDSYFTDEESCSLSSSKEFIKSDGEKELSDIDLSIIQNAFKNETEGYSSSSEESCTDLIDDCEGEFIRIPPKECLFLAYTNLKKDGVRQLYELSLKMEFCISKKYLHNKTTHLIIPEEWEVKSLTYQHLAAIAHKSHIVTFKWVADCLAADRILPTREYIPNLPGALSCLNNNRKLLFEGYSLCVHSLELQIKEQNQHLAETCGATVFKDIVHLCGSRSKHKILLSETLNPDLLLQCINLGIYPVHSSWLHDSIIKYEAQSMEPYGLIDTSEMNFDLFTELNKSVI